MQYKGVKHYLEKYLNENIKDKALKMYDGINEDFIYWPASVKYHHNKQGGLDQHTEEVIYCGLKIFKSLEEEFRKRLVTESDVVFIGFIHDLEKLTKYVVNKDYNEDTFKPNVYEFKYNYNKVDYHDSAEVVNLCSKYGITLSKKQLNALCYHHGGWTKDQGKLESLAALMHMADLMSVYVIYIK